MSPKPDEQEHELVPSKGILEINALPTLKPELWERAWSSVPHPTLPLIATSHARSITVYSLTDGTSHSTLTDGHTRSIRTAAWKPSLPPHKLCLASASFDATVGIWRWDETDANEREVTAAGHTANSDDDEPTDANARDWEFTLVLEGHDSEVKSATFSPSGATVATCSRDKTIWIWEDIGANEDDDEWETVAVLNEHEGDVKRVSFCPDVPGRLNRRDVYHPECLASGSYDNTARIWRQDADQEWVCVSVIEGHEKTVWGCEWEADPNRKLFPRFLTYSADGTIKVWTFQPPKRDPEDEGGPDDDGGAGEAFKNTWSQNFVPSTMRASINEDWKCTAMLPTAHDTKYDVYSASWSPKTGLVASAGGDGRVCIYREDKETGEWEVLAVKENAHGPDEVNHVTWCGRWDGGRGGQEEMLVSTGDDGVVRQWEVKEASTS